MAKPIQQAVTVVERSKKELNSLLPNSEFAYAKLEINTLFDRILTRLKFMGGTLEATSSTASKSKFGPLTSFLGDKIVRIERVAVGDLNPKEAEKKVFLEKVNALYDSFLETDASSILKNYTIPEDVLVLRGVAKRAGVEGYDKRELNVAFIEDIALAIEMKKEEADKQKEIDAAALKARKDEEEAEKKKAAAASDPGKDPSNTKTKSGDQK